MDETDLFRNLSMLGGYPQLDYLSRTVITSLIFNDRGFMSKHLIRIWTSGNPENRAIAVRRAWTLMIPLGVAVHPS